MFYFMKRNVTRSDFTWQRGVEQATLIYWYAQLLSFFHSAQSFRNSDNSAQIQKKTQE